MSIGTILIIGVAIIHGAVLSLALVNLAYLRRRAGRPLPSDDAALPSLSILIPARNEEANLARLLPSLMSQDYPDFEVVVVDDASEDSTWEVIQRHADPRLVPIKGAGPPPGWIGKVHALYQATRKAQNEVYLFLDADAELRDPAALRRMVTVFASHGGNVVMSGLPRFRGKPGGLLLTSLVPLAIIGALPIPLVPRTRTSAIGALNGQIWLIHATDYQKHEPHQALPAEILEDVQIGRYLKRQGMTVHFEDVGGALDVYMYNTASEAWHGFRKNAYLLQGGRPLTFLLSLGLFFLTFVVAPWLGWTFLASTVLIKGVCDIGARLPWWVIPFAPAILLAGAAVQIASAYAHLVGQVTWKGRTV
jgi:glycosyltransferase involved in cell wall biosynthesis